MKWFRETDPNQAIQKPQKSADSKIRRLLKFGKILTNNEKK